MGSTGRFIAGSALTALGLVALPGVAGAAGPPDDFAVNTDYGTGESPRSAALGDVNNDSILDMVTANPYDSSVSVLLGNGDGTFQAKTDYPVADFSGPSAVALGDVDGDNALDIIAANDQRSWGLVAVLLGNGDGTFKAKTDFHTGRQPISVALGDVNGDNNLDIVTANYTENSTSVLLGQGDGTFATKTDYSIGGPPLGVALSDVNGDTHLDIIAAVGRASVLLGNGDGTFKAKIDYPTGIRPHSVALGDVNNDSHVDIVTANQAGRSASVLLGNGDGTFKPRTDFPTGASPRSVALGDVNNDSLPDIVTANLNANTASVLLGNGDGTFKAKTDYPTGAIPRSVALGDVDGDAKPDIVTASQGSNSASVLLNTTAPAVSFIGDALHITPPPASTVGTTTKYMIIYNTPDRIDSGASWGTWAMNWPATKLAIPLPDTETKTACETFAGAPTVCDRPAAIGIHTPGTTYSYRILANTGTTWTTISDTLTITRPN